MAEECPTCDRTFDSRRGLAVHHSQAHGERLPNRTCDHCGTDFHSPHERRYCSDECRDEAVSFEGADNPNYRGGQTETTCELCGDPFTFYESAKPGRYCEACVDSEPWRDPPAPTASDHHAWRGGPLTLSCDVCDSPVERYPSQVIGEVTLCSRDCHAEWLSESFTGEGHSNWRGGGIDEYGPGWRAVREAALERDDHACALCGTDADALGRNPDVHHIVPVRLFAAAPALAVRDAHALWNVVCLCPSCHRQAEFGGVTPAELRWRAGLPAGSPADDCPRTIPR